ncbi:secretion and cellular translocation Q domain protein, partial [Chlamydia psittaci 84-8471/1]
LLKSF